MWVQGGWFAHVASRVLLPKFQQAGRPFVMVFWSRDPDGSQHNQGDSLGSLTPGHQRLNLAGRHPERRRYAGGTSVHAEGARPRQGRPMSSSPPTTAFPPSPKRAAQAARRSSPIRMCRLESFRRASPRSTSRPRSIFRSTIPLVRRRPGGWVVTRRRATSSSAIRPSRTWSSPPTAGADLIYLPKRDARANLAKRVVATLWAQDYTGAVFVNDALGRLPGTLPMSAVGLIGAALTPQPDIVVSFRSFSTGCAQPELCAAEVADTSLQQGQGIHGSLSRADTHNFMAAIGPDFRTAFVDATPTSNADLARTMTHLLRLEPVQHGRLRGRVLTESLRGGAPVAFSRHLVRSPRGPTGGSETLLEQQVGAEHYYDAAGAPGRAVGLPQ